MAARYTGQFFGPYTDQQYTVVLYDDDFSGTPETITIQDVGFQYPQGSTNTRFDPILSAKMSVKFFINTSGLVTFVEDLAGARSGNMKPMNLGMIPSSSCSMKRPSFAPAKSSTNVTRPDVLMRI